MFSAMMEEDKWIREAAFALGYCDRYFHQIGHYVDFPSSKEKHDISEDQIRRAKEVFSARKAELLARATAPGVLTFVCMGGDYQSTIPDGVGNYRIRAYFLDADSRLQFIELHPHYRHPDPDDSLGFYGDWTDKAFEDEEQERYEREVAALQAQLGARWFLRTPADKRPEHPRQRHGNLQVNDLPFTPGGILEYVNKTYHTHYKEVFISRYILTYHADNSWHPAFVCSW